MRTALAAPPVLAAVEQEFYAAYATLTAAMADISKRPRGRREYPFENAVEDAELLLKHASETGTAVDQDTACNVLAAHTALKSNAITDAVRGSFYTAYGDLSKLFGDVTAETIRNCSARKTQQELKWNRWCALGITAAVALVSVGTFVADSLVKKINDDIPVANDLAAKLRTGLTSGDGSQPISPELARNPCVEVDKPSADERSMRVRNVTDVTQLQEFAGIIRELQSRSVKLNSLLRRITFSRVEECDSFLVTCSADEHSESAKDSSHVTKEKANASYLQIYPAIVNYPAEVLCRIKTFQDVRTFATNVRDNYTSVVGAFTSYALPIVYALLGAFAYRLRLFADTIRKRMYHPSFADSARMITAVIAGAICGLFNPAQGLALSPLAVAFLVGYGVELFFKLLDTLINSFGSGTRLGSPSDPARH